MGSIEKAFYSQRLLVKKKSWIIYLLIGRLTLRAEQLFRLNVFLRLRFNDGWF
nr:MAG TPA: hypothetical protein [Caudoviricetes sp.]